MTQAVFLQATPPKLETILCVDTETSGLPPDAKLLEIGCAWWSITHGCVLACWSELVINATNEAEAINRIPVAVLGHGLLPSQALEAIRSRAARADIVVAHRSEFDSFFLPNIGKPWVCSKYSIEWPNSNLGDSLVPIAVANGVAVTHAHRALTDVFLLVRLFERVHERVGAEGVRAMLVRAMRPKKRYKALVSFDDKDLAKTRGFRWVPETKSWIRDMPPEDIEAVAFPFKLAEVAS